MTEKKTAKKAAAKKAPAKPKSNLVPGTAEHKAAVLRGDIKE